MNKNNLSRVFEKSLILILMLSFAEGNLTIAQAQAESQDSSITNIAGGHQGHPAPISNGPGNAAPTGTVTPLNPSGPVTTIQTGGVSGTGPGPGPGATAGNGGNNPGIGTPGSSTPGSSTPGTGTSGTSTTGSNPPVTGNSGTATHNPGNNTTGGSSVSTSNSPTTSSPTTSSPTTSSPTHATSTTTSPTTSSTTNPTTTATTTVTAPTAGTGTTKPAPGDGSSSVSTHNNGKSTTQPVNQTPSNTVSSGPVLVITPPSHPAPVTPSNGKSSTRPVVANGGNNGSNSGPVSIAIPGGKSGTRAVSASGNNSNSGPVGLITPATTNTTATNGGNDSLSGTTTFSTTPGVKNAGGAVTAPNPNSMGNVSLPNPNNSGTTGAGANTSAANANGANSGNGSANVKTVPINNASGAGSGSRVPSASNTGVDSAATSGTQNAVILPPSIPPLKKPVTTTTTNGDPTTTTTTTNPPANPPTNTTTPPTTTPPTTTTAAPTKGSPAGGGTFDPGAGGNTVSNPVTPNSCEDKALKAVYDLLIADNHNAIGIMFELTAMRLAKRALEQKPNATTLEDLTAGNIKALKDQLNTADPNHTMSDAIKTAYQTYGEPGDLKTAEERFDQDAAAAIKKAPTACYFDQSTTRRFRNDETSAYIMAVSVAEPDSGLTEADAATVWVVERARKEAEKRDPGNYAIGKADGNLLNISTRVARYLGRIIGGRNVTADQMAAMIAAQEQALNGIISGAYAQVKVSLQACLSTECVDCNTAKARFDKFDSENAGFDKIQRGLLETVARSDNMKVLKDLKGKIGENTFFDLSNFANAKDKSSSEAGIPSLPPRGTHDICGNTLRRHHTGTTTVAKPPVVATPPVVTDAPVTAPTDPAPTAPVTPPVTTVSNPAKPTKHGKKSNPTVPNPPVDPITLGNPVDTTDPTPVKTPPASPGNPRTDPIIRGSGPAPAAISPSSSAPAVPAAAEVVVSGPATSTTKPAVPPAQTSDTAPAVFSKSFEEFNQDLQAKQVSETGSCAARIETIEGKTVVVGINGNTKQTIENTPAALQAFYQQCSK